MLIALYYYVKDNQLYKYVSICNILYVVNNYISCQFECFVDIIFLHEDVLTAVCSTQYTK